MLLRRIIGHIRTQNWFAVFLDFLIVVVGVFIGIQMSNTNSALSDRAFESKLLADLQADLRLDVADFDKTITTNNRRIAAVTYALSAVGDETPLTLPDTTGPDDDASSITTQAVEDAIEELDPERLWSTAMISFFADPSTTALDALLGSGELHVLRDEQLLRALQQYRQSLDSLQRSQESIFTDLRNTAFGIGLAHGVTPFEPVPEAQLTLILEESTEMRAALRAQAGLAGAHNQQIEVVRTSAREILTQLGDTP